MKCFIIISSGKRFHFKIRNKYLTLETDGNSQCCLDTSVFLWSAPTESTPIDSRRVRRYVLVFAIKFVCLSHEAVVKNILILRGVSVLLQTKIVLVFKVYLMKR